MSAASGNLDTTTNEFDSALGVKNPGEAFVHTFQCSGVSFRSRR